MTLEKTFVFQYVILQHAFTKSGAKGLHSVGEKSTYAGNRLHNELRLKQPVSLSLNKCLIF